jgi:Predicted integral membrane protein
MIYITPNNTNQIKINSTGTNKAAIFIRAIFLILLAVWSAFIFIRSSKTSLESSEESGEIIKMIAGVIDRDFDNLPVEKQNDYISNLQFLVRKAAHFTAYTLLGILAAATAISFAKNPLVGYIYSIFYASSDEIHQRFVAGRSCELRDFLIDISGALLGIIIAFVFVSFINAIKKKHRINKT